MNPLQKKLYVVTLHTFWCKLKVTGVCRLRRKERDKKRKEMKKLERREKQEIQKKKEKNVPTESKGLSISSLEPGSS